jgi:predicted transposase YbfD/YdcC
MKALTRHPYQKVFRMDGTTVTVSPFNRTQPFTLDLAAVHQQVQRIPDLRKPRGVRYPLAVLLTIARWAKLAGYSQVREIAEWARERQAELAKRFALTRPCMPHPTTWSRVLASAVAAEALEQALAALMLPAESAQVATRASQQLARDGKSLRGTIPYGCSQGVHLLSAYAVQRGVVLAQEAVVSKENELVVAPRLLKRLQLRGVVVTGDAKFAQRARSTPVVEAGGDDCWTVKENQPTLLDDLKLLFSPVVLPVATGWSHCPLDVVVEEQHKKVSGRCEYRRLTTSSLLMGYSDWPYLAQAFELVRITRRGRHVSREERDGITSVPAEAVSARRLLAMVRGHWQIEHGLHDRRDVSLGEDGSRVRMGQAPHMLACLNNAVCGLAARGGQTNLAALQRSLAAASDRLLFRS